MGGELTITGYYSTRSWIKEHGSLVRGLQNFSEFKETGFKYWEYPFVFKEVMKRPNSKILDIGTGQGSISSVLAKNGHEVISVDQFDSSWEQLKEVQAKTAIKCINGDARNLHMFDDSEFDIALLISVIEHIPSNTIFCEKRRVPKTSDMLQEEMPEKLRAIAEAIRVVKPGGIVIITSDIYLDYPSDMNISWEEMIGVTGVDADSFNDRSNLYYHDAPFHKGRVLSVGIIIEKHGDKAHEEILNRIHNNKSSKN